MKTTQEKLNKGIARMEQKLSRFQNDIWDAIEEGIYESSFYATSEERQYHGACARYKHLVKVWKGIIYAYIQDYRTELYLRNSGF